MSVSRTVSEIDGDFSRKAQNIPISRVFAPQLKGLGTAYWRSASKTRKMGQPCREKSLTISLAVWIKCTNMTDRQTNGRTEGHLATAKTALEGVAPSVAAGRAAVGSCFLAFFC